jgi:hypothetical protein
MWKLFTFYLLRKPFWYLFGCFCCFDYKSRKYSALFKFYDPLFIKPMARRLFQVLELFDQKNENYFLHRYCYYFWSRIEFLKTKLVFRKVFCGLHFCYSWDIYLTRWHFFCYKFWKIGWIESFCVSNFYESGRCGNSVYAHAHLRNSLPFLCCANSCWLSTNNSSSLL